MLLKKAILFQMGLFAILDCSDVYAMETDFTTPMRPKRRTASALEPGNVETKCLEAEKVVGPERGKTENPETDYAAEIKKLWGFFEQSETVDVEDAKFVFGRIAADFTEAEQFEVLNFFLGNTMRSHDAFTAWLAEIEQLSDATPGSRYNMFKAMAIAETPN